MKNDEEYTKENSRAQLTIERALKSSKEKMKKGSIYVGKRIH
jgi:hypothetical protein